ncbi:hypothetical protein HPB49_018723 [Dermacentor silvarum]|uniref:Uncharacterized protein n=1 Tax=Dermacentor silvarum TaxID=543639 RepID=A0ACB8D7E7_DERSI|nr:hypothetical protein HPB49_018723 [Dermacentor silvarum]
MRYCLEELKFKYVLLQKFKTDTVEDRFGRYRQLAGAQYHLSERQLLESEKKNIRLQKLLMLLQPHSNSENDTEVSQHNFSVHISNEEISSSKHDMEVVAYIAGYCAHSTLKKVSCILCSSILILENRNIDVECSTMIANLSRGSLRFPQPCTVHMVLVTTPVVEKLTKGENAKPFLASNNQRGIVRSIATSLLGDVELETCENGHTGGPLLHGVNRRKGSGRGSGALATPHSFVVTSGLASGKATQGVRATLRWLCLTHTFGRRLNGGVYRGPEGA